MLIGVLALQGAFVEHQHHLKKLGVESRQVRTVSDLNGLHGLIIPGGESTSMRILAEKSPGLLDALKKWVHVDKKPVWGTCAGLILLANNIVEQPNDPKILGGLDISVQRNFYGRQLQSFQAQVPVTFNPADPAIPLDGPSSTTVPGVFIRAPAIQSIHDQSIHILATYQTHPIAVRQGHVMGCAFHPELTDDTGFHRYFLHMVRQHQ